MEKLHDLSDQEIDDMMDKSDYTGVPTHELASLLDQGGIGQIQGYKEFAQRVKVGYNSDGSAKYIEDRWIYRIHYEEVPWVSLHIADCICMALGRHVTKDLTVIPAGYPNSAKKMAEDEFWVADVIPTEEQMDNRVDELRALRAAKIHEGEIKRDERRTI